MKHKLILSVSRKMNTNKKRDRREGELIRLGSKARSYLGLDQERTVELWPANPNSVEDRINRNKILTIHEAYTSDLKNLSKQIGVDITEDEFLRTGFVTSNTFDLICGGRNDEDKNIWISENIDDTVIGADPEFILIKDDGSIEYAANIAGFDFSGKLGSDGPLAEVRPDPAIEVKDFISNISKILKTHPKVNYIRDYGWKAGCCPITEEVTFDRTEWPIGGHIHVGTPSIIAHKFKDENFGNSFKTGLFVALAKILDELLAIPMMKLDNKKESIARRNNYGHFGDLRTDRERLEYRVLSGIWISHPKLASYTLGTAKAITDSFFHLLEDNKFKTEYVSSEDYKFRSYHDMDMFEEDSAYWKSVKIAKDFGATRSAGEMCSILNDYDFIYTKQEIAKMKNNLKALPSYSKYSEFIDGLIEVISIPKKDLENINSNLKATWIEGEDFII